MNPNLTKEKRAEYDALCAYYLLVSKRPSNTTAKAILRELRDICSRQYGIEAFRQLHRTATAEAAEARRNAPQSEPQGKKLTGGGSSSSRRSQPPGNKEPKPGTARWERVQKRLAQGGQGGKSAAEVVAADEPKMFSPEPPENEPQNVTENDLSLTAKEIAEKYGRDALVSYLLQKGEDAETLAQKSDKQLANMFKKTLVG